MTKHNHSDTHSFLENESDNPDILVTGGSGLVGSELILQLLAAGNKVRAIYNKTPLSDYNDKNLTSFKCNILDVSMLEYAMKGISKVYHCAAVVSLSSKNKDALFAINVEGTANIVNTAIEAGVKKLLHVSSVAALGRLREGQHVTEEMYWTEETNNSNYGKSKYLAEMEVWRGIGEGLQAVIVNPTLILGGTNWNTGSMEIFKTAFEEFPWYTEGISGFIDVRDVAKAMILLMESGITDQRFILNAQNLPYKDVFSDIARSFRKKPPHKKVTPFLAELVWRLEALKTLFTGREHLLTKETARTGQAKVYFDNSKIKKNLPGFSFRPITQTINDTCATLKRINHL
jgi:nucleoside-diphosphate-sugar epimerase